MDKNHFLNMLASKSGHPSIHEERPYWHILGNPYKNHKQNEAKVVNLAKNKIATKFDKFQIEA